MKAVGALHSSGKQPAHTVTPSRRLQQTNIRDSLAGLHRKAEESNTKRNNNAELSQPRSPTTEPTSDTTDDDEEVTTEEDEEDSLESPRKIARTSKENTSPSKQLLLFRETMASRYSFNSSRSNVEETPTGRLQNLALKTPASNARAQAEQSFNSITPVKKPNFGTAASKTPSRSWDSANPFASAKKENSKVNDSGLDTPRLAFTNNVIDAETVVFELLDEGGVDISDSLRNDLAIALQKIRNQSRMFQKSRDTTREHYQRMNSEVTSLNNKVKKLESEVEALRTKCQDSIYSSRINKATVEEQKKDIERLTKEKEELEGELDDADEVKQKLEAEISRLREESQRH
ncbi:hypothetical protein ABW19_dt0208764 [Dactylella cylindrospora]|nr:hypothetical protein ABW19_dt0208764 [Dactylella cylindrospora]